MFSSSSSFDEDNNNRQMPNNYSSRKSSHIPCLYLPFQNGSSKLLLYFHGNAEDVGISYEMLDHFRNALKINVLAMEYPGYGVFQESGGCSANKIREDANYVFHYILQETKLVEGDIVIFGRSIGSGPAVYLAANNKPGGVILMSAYTSIKNIARDKVGWLSFIMGEHFDNISLISQVTSPTFLVHG